MKTTKLANRMIENYLDYSPAACVITDNHAFLNIAIKRNYSEVSLFGTVFYLENGEYVNCGCSHEFKVGKQYYRDDLDPEMVRDWIEHMIYVFSCREDIDFQKFL
jgi:hypothetical protein